MSRKTENTAFVCENCGRPVPPLTNGSYRNHCPFCLCSKHVDEVPGDRASDCGGVMDPVAVLFRPGKGWQIVHRCRRCGAERRNVAAENTEAPDDGALLRALAAEPRREGTEKQERRKTRRG